ncbi:CCN family member 2 [Heteronotia binoei]|uniref:CCN family member 2 n=1 Tax=Heteronotia binoei TaxID=13085 RepID=UPI00292D3FA5|nr:CCN family member 2 [Heteronotia binoei]
MLAARMRPGSFALALLVALFGREVAGQDCSGQCQCPSAPAQCPPGVSLVQDGCDCCRVCAKQLGELCTERDPCDHHKGLFCDFGSPVNRKIGVCTARDGAPCVFGGMVYRSGESFQSSCKYQCTCLDGAVGCVPLCSMDVRLPSPDCPFPRRVKLPGKCCEEWVCDEPKDKEQTAVGPALAAYRLEDTYGPDPSLMRANCLVQTTEWSACSKTCGMGISTRVTNDNAFCRLEKQSRLCMVRPCEADLEESIKKGKKCIRTPKISKPIKFELSGCTSVKTYRAKFCGVCTDGRCCTPHRTATLAVEFKCPDGEVMKKRMMFIKTCACHYNCPGDNDIFESVYYRKMYGDMA